MNPEVPVRDIMRRTMFNLHRIESQASDDGPYEVTQLVNSFLGALAHPWERFKQQLNSISLPVAESQGWPRVIKERNEDSDPKNLGDLVRLLRNGIAHGNIIFIPDSNNEIRAIQLWNTDPRTERRTWGAVLTVDVLRQLLNHFVGLAEELNELPTNTGVRAPRNLQQLLVRLQPKERRGSKARCHLLTHGSRECVAQRLTQLIEPWGEVRPTDHWLPDGFDNPREARLGESAKLLDAARRAELRSWWLAVERGANTPNWDIASTCTIDGKHGLLLIEAKAHDKELRKEEKGKDPADAKSEGSRANHDRIYQAINLANQGLEQATGKEWKLARDSRYQMSNRFAWTWKTVELGVPVILVYLGMLGADEMADQGLPLANAESWTSLVLSHSKPLFPDDIWNHSWMISGQPFIPLINSIQQPLALPMEEVET